jgi:hypothetical protein
LQLNANGKNWKIVEEEAMVRDAWFEGIFTKIARLTYAGASVRETIPFSRCVVQLG